MAALDEQGDVLAFGDDGSPFGGYASGLIAQVNSDGTIRLLVSGYGDDDFAGDHDEEGAYDLYIWLGVSDWAEVGATGPDVDFFRWVDLPAGMPFVAEITQGDLDTMLFLLDDSGAIITYDDDGGEGLLSRLEGTIPASGHLNFAVTGYGDYDLIGEHGEYGPYTLVLTVVPEPGTLLLLAIGAVGLVIRRGSLR